MLHGAVADCRQVLLGGARPGVVGAGGVQGGGGGAEGPTPNGRRSSAVGGAADDGGEGGAAVGANGGGGADAGAVGGAAGSGASSSDGGSAPVRGRSISDPAAPDQRQRRANGSSTALISQQCGALLFRCLQFGDKLEHRIQMRQLLCHPWLAGTQQPTRPPLTRDRHAPGRPQVQQHVGGSSPQGPAPLETTRRFTPSAPRQQRPGNSPRVSISSPKLLPAQAGAPAAARRPAAIKIGTPIMSVGERAVSPLSPFRLNSEPNSPISPALLASDLDLSDDAAAQPPAPCSSPKLRLRRMSAAAASTRAASPTVAGAILKLNMEQAAQPPLAPPPPGGGGAMSGSPITDALQEPDSPLSPFSPSGVDALSSFQHVSEAPPTRAGARNCTRDCDADPPCPNSYPCRVDPQQMSLRARRQMERIETTELSQMPKLGGGASKHRVPLKGPRWPSLAPVTPKLKSANAIIARGDEVAARYK